MPAAPRPRQASVAEWFATEQGQRLDVLQSQAVAERLPQRPSQPVLWLSPAPSWPACKPASTLRLVCLHASDGRWEGELQCRLPFPLASAGFGTVILQHPPRDQCQSLLEEVERLLLPGGVLWLLAGNPAHPSRLLHPQHPLWAAPAGGWRQALQAQGLTVRDSCRIGPAGLGLETAGLLLEAEKRTVAPIGPRPLRPLVPRLAGRSTCTKVT